MMVYREFVGQDQKALYLQAVAELPGGSLSPGGAAILLGVTRQHATDLAYRHPDVRAWVYREAPGQRAAYLELSLTDVLRYGVATRRFRIGDELPYVGVLEETHLTE